jgi:hypothetical protein
VAMAKVTSLIERVPLAIDLRDEGLPRILLKRPHSYSIMSCCDGTAG